jgi:spermidine synthase
VGRKVTTASDLSSSWSGRLGLGLFLSSLVLLSMELVLVRIFSVLMWYHFVSLIVSLALFGLTASGLAVFLFPRLFPPSRTEEWLGRAALLLCASILLQWLFFLLLSRHPLLAYKVLAPFHQPFYEPFGPSSSSYLSWSVAGSLTVVFLFSVLPFLLGGFVVTLSISRYSSSIAGVYFSDLAGAGAGCLATFLLLTFLDPFSALGLLAGGAALAALCFFWKRAGFQWKAAAAVLVALSLGIGGATAREGLVELKFVRGRYEPDIRWTRWNSYSRVAVYPLRSGQAEGSWGMSRRFRGKVPRQMGMVVDDTGYSSIARYAPGDDLDWARATLFALPYSLREGAEALIIGPGGGKEIHAARSMGAEKVRAVEINPLMVRAVEEEFGDFSGRPYSLPGVEGVIDEGRTFIRKDASRYDVIQASVVYGRLAPSAGAFTLTEDHLYTVEAFHDYLARLKPEGMLAFSRFLFEKRILRMVATARQALVERGAEYPATHFFIASERGMATVLVKAAAFTAEELASLEERCRRQGFTVLYSPLREKGNPFDRLLRAADAEEFYAGLDYDVAPVTDDRPFFYYLIRPADFFRSLTGLAGPDFDDRALVLIRNLLFVVFVMVVLFFAVPLFLRGRAGEIEWASAWPVLLFFASLGLGFIVVEITLLKRFILLLGKPVYSVAVILFSFLLAGGLGSHRSRRFTGDRRALRRKCSVLVAVLLLMTLLLPAIIEVSLPLGLAGRLAVTVLVVAPMGYLMGQPFPLGVALLRLRSERLIPWGWSLNGALSVLGAILTLVLAVNFGYTTTMLVGPAAYLIAAIAAEDL